MTVMGAEEAEVVLLKSREYWVPVLVLWVVEAELGWRIDGVDQAGEVAEVEQPTAMMQLRL